MGYIGSVGSFEPAANVQRHQEAGMTMNFQKTIEGINSFDALKSFEKQVERMALHPTTKNRLLREATRHYVDNYPLH